MSDNTILRPDFIRLAFNDNDAQYASVDEIIYSSLTEIFDSQSGISMGSACSSKFVVTLLIPELLEEGRVKVPYADSFLIPYACFADGSHADIPLGKFYVNTVELSNEGKTITLECFDKFCKLDTEYQFDYVEEPIETVIEKIGQTFGFDIDFDFAGYESYVISQTYQGTARQLIGHIAGMMGMNARFNRQGNLTFGWYKTSDDQQAPLTLSADLIHRGQFNLLDEEATIISCVLSGTQDNMVGSNLDSNEGSTITFENPYINETQLSSVLSNVKGLHFVPCNLKCRGDLRIEAGMLIEVQHNDTLIPVCVMEQVIVFNGGMSSEIFCYANEADSEVFQSTFSAGKLSPKNESRLENLVRIKKNILESNGGFFEIIDADKDGIEDGFILRDGSGSGNYILANKEGIILMQRNEDGVYIPKNALSFEGINTELLDADKIRSKCLTISGHSMEDIFSINTDPEDVSKGISLKIGSSESTCYLEQSSNSFGFYSNDNNTPNMVINPNSILIGMLTIHLSSGGNIIFSTGGK